MVELISFVNKVPLRTASGPATCCSAEAVGSGARGAAATAAANAAGAAAAAVAAISSALSSGVGVNWKQNSGLRAKISNFPGRGEEYQTLQAAEAL